MASMVAHMDHAAREVPEGHRQPHFARHVPAHTTAPFCLSLVLGLDVGLKAPVQVDKGRAVDSVAQLEVPLRKPVDVVGPRKEAQWPALLSLRPALLALLRRRSSAAPAVDHRSNEVVELVVAVAVAVAVPVASVVRFHSSGCGGYLQGGHGIK
jgi:hypothetical protein